MALPPLDSEGVEIEKLTGRISDSKANTIRTSGMLKSHYSPKAKVKLGKHAKPGDGFLALEFVPTPLGAYRLASPVNVDDYAQKLYFALRMADRGYVIESGSIQLAGSAAELSNDSSFGKKYLGN